LSTTHSQFVGSIPEIYDLHLGPLLFEFSAQDLAERVRTVVPEGGKILEVACGTGISTEYLHQTLGAATLVVATDLNEAMIDYARAKRGGLPGVTFEIADALALPYQDAGYDAVVCQFGIMFFPDKAKGLAEMARVLKPGGLLAFNVWDALYHNPVAQVAQETMARFFQDGAPKFLETPFGFAEIDPIRSMIDQAGLRGFDSHVVTATVERPDARHVARGLVEGNPGVLEVRERATAEVETVVEAVTQAVEMAFGPPPLKFSLQEIVFTAFKP
jgi:ubiquinone/menaquinone biosynthesis C-methylase UbiE